MSGIIRCKETSTNLPIQLTFSDSGSCRRSYFSKVPGSNPLGPGNDCYKLIVIQSKTYIIIEYFIFRASSSEDTKLFLLIV